MDDNPPYLTISIDDGHPSDLRAADLLDELRLKATFYVPATNRRRAVLDRMQLRELSDRFELGAHTFHHATLTDISLDQARREIVDGKAWLEDITGKPVQAFCYPRGKFDSRVVQLVMDAGFAGARTCMQNRVDAPRNPYLWGVSTQAFWHPRRVQVRHAALEANWTGLINFGRIFRGAVDWEQHFERAVAHVAKHGGVAHLYFHSWELDERAEWAKLRRLLTYARDCHALAPIANAELFARAGNF